MSPSRLLLEPVLRDRTSGRPHDALVFSAPGGGYPELRWIERAMGHESITTTALYAHLDEDGLDIVAVALDRLIRSERTAEVPS